MRGLLIVVCLAAACGNDDSSGGPYVGLDQLQQAYKTAVCKHLVMCGEFADQDTCITTNIMMPYQVSQADIDAVFAGREYYDGGKVAACFDKIAAATCDTTDADSRFDYACAFGIFRGAQLAGEACAFDNECVSGQCATSGCGNLQCCQ